MQKRKMWGITLTLALVILVAGLSRLVQPLAQQAGGADALRARASRDLAFQQNYSTQPGGTEEERLWQLLVLMGIDDQQPTSWKGSL